MFGSLIIILEVPGSHFGPAILIVFSKYGHRNLIKSAFRGNRLNIRNQKILTFSKFSTQVGWMKYFRGLLRLRGMENDECSTTIKF
jgi:hypothetical protein